MRRASSFLPMVLIVAAVAWLAVGSLVVPEVIRAVYAGLLLPGLHAVLERHPSLTLDFLLAQWSEMRLYAFIGMCVFAGLLYALRTPTWSKRLVGRTTPEAIGAIRMLVCTILLMSTLWEDLSSTAAIPRELIQPMGVIHLLYVLPIGFDRLAASPEALSIFKLVTAALLGAGMIGWRTRWTLPAAALCYLIVGGLLRQYAWFYHTGLITLYVLIVLCFVPAGDGWSIDRLRRIWRGEAVPPSDQPTERYGWARFAVWTVIALPYVAAGLSKLRNGGLSWLEAENMKHILFQSALRPMEFDFELSLMLTSAPDVVFEVLAVTAVAGEILYGLVLFFGWARVIMPAAMLLMHVGILFLQNILFFDLILIQLIFFNWRPLRDAIAHRLAAARGEVDLYLDMSMRREAGLARLVSAVDFFRRIRVHDRSLRGTTETARHGARSLPVGRPVARWGEGEYRDARLLRLVAGSIPALWLLVPLSLFQGVWRRILYGTRAPASRVRAPARDVRDEAAMPRRLVLTIIAVLMLCWIFRVELYPFTGMQMFSTRKSSPVTYETAVAHLESGESIRAPIEESIGAMADSRYRRILQMAFHEERTDRMEHFFRVVMERWNSRVMASMRIEAIEVQRWEWDFRAHPEDPDFGRVVESRIVRLSPLRMSSDP